MKGRRIERVLQERTVVLDNGSIVVLNVVELEDDYAIEGSVIPARGRYS